MKQTLLLISLLFISLHSWSEETNVSVDSYNADFSFTPGNILIGKFASDLGYIDNFLYSDSKKLSTSFLEIGTSAFMQIQKDRNLFQLQANYSFYKFSEFSQDDHNDYDLTAKYHFKFSENQRLSITGHYLHAFEYRGTGISQGDANLLISGDEKEASFLNIGYYYGHDESVARVWLLAGKRNFDYTTRRDLTKTLNYSGDYLKGGIDYLYSGKSYFTAKVNYEDLTYQYDVENSRIEKSALIGFKWFSSVSTKAEFLFGFSKLEFYETDNETKDNFKWEVDLIWQPLSFTGFIFSSARTVEEASQINSGYKIVDNYSLSMKHELSDYVKVLVELGRKNQLVVFANNERDENHNLLSVNFNYLKYHWLSLSAHYEFKQLKSTLITDDFDRNSISLGFHIKI